MKSFYIFLAALAVCVTSGCKKDDNPIAVHPLPPILYGQVVNSQGIPIEDVNVHYIFEIPGSLDGKIENVDSKNFKIGKTCPSTTIFYTIPKRCKVTLTIFRLYTRDTIATLVNDTLESGYYSRTFDASKITNGFYFYQLKVDTSIQEKTMVLLNVDISTLILADPLAKTNSSGSFELPYALLGFGIPITLVSSDGQNIDTAEISTTINIVLNKSGFTTLTQKVTVDKTVGMKQTFVLNSQ